MRPFARIAIALALIAGAMTWAWVLVEMHAAKPAQPRDAIELPDLDELEGRLVRAAEITRRWEWLRERSEGAEEVACESLARHAEGWRDVRAWRAPRGDER